MWGILLIMSSILLGIDIFCWQIEGLWGCIILLGLFFLGLFSLAKIILTKNQRIKWLNETIEFVTSLIEAIISL